MGLFLRAVINGIGFTLGKMILEKVVEHYVEVKDGKKADTSATDVVDIDEILEDPGDDAVRIE